MTHPLYLQRVTLADGRTGTAIEVHGDGEAFMVELIGATGLDGIETVRADDLEGVVGLLAQLHRGSIDVTDMTADAFEAFIRGREGC